MPRQYIIFKKCIDKQKEDVPDNERKQFAVAKTQERGKNYVRFRKRKSTEPLPVSEVDIKFVQVLVLFYKYYNNKCIHSSIAIASSREVLCYKK